MEPLIGRELDCLGVSLKVVMHVHPRLVKVRVSVGVYHVSVFLLNLVSDFICSSV